MSKFIVRISLCFLFAFLVSCGSNAVYEQNKQIENSCWHKDSVAKFQFDATDTAGVYDIIIDVRNAAYYGYQNLWLFVKSVSPEGNVFCDTIECVLADNRGKWIGKGGGSLYHLPVLCMGGIKFPVTGLYKFEIVQGMREDIISGISDIGLRIEKSLLAE